MPVPTSVTCPVCHVAVAVGSAFCTRCGAALAVTTVIAPGVGPDDQRWGARPGPVPPGWGPRPAPAGDGGAGPSGAGPQPGGRPSRPRR